MIINNDNADREEEAIHTLMGLLPSLIIYPGTVTQETMYHIYNELKGESGE